MKYTKISVYPETYELLKAYAAYTNRPIIRTIDQLVRDAMCEQFPVVNRTVATDELYSPSERSSEAPPQGDGIIDF